MHDRFILTCVSALALALLVGPALPAGAAPVADGGPVAGVLVRLTDGLSSLAELAARLGVVHEPGTAPAGDAPTTTTDDGSDAPVALDGDGGQELRPERFG